MKWCIKTKAKPYKCGSQKCDLCLDEKVAIARFKEVALLNKQTELISKWTWNKQWTSAVTELIITLLFEYQLNCVIVRVSVECYTPVKVCTDWY